MQYQRVGKGRIDSCRGIQGIYLGRNPRYQARTVILGSFQPEPSPNRGCRWRRQTVPSRASHGPHRSLEWLVTGRRSCGRWPRGSPRLPPELSRHPQWVDTTQHSLFRPALLSIGLLLVACSSSSSGTDPGAAFGSAEIGFSASALQTGEGQAPLAVEVSIDEAVDADILATVAATGTASVGDDVVISPLTVTILAGQTSGATVITVFEDSLFEIDETLTLEIAGVTSDADIEIGDTPQVQVTIADNDSAPTVFLLSGSYAGTEDQAEIRIPVRLSAVAGVDIEVPATFSGSAGATDFQTPLAGITIPAGASQADFVLIPVDDDLDEGPEELVITLGQPNFGSLDGLTETTLTLSDAQVVPWGPVVFAARPLSPAAETQLYTSQIAGAGAVTLTPDHDLTGPVVLSPDGLQAAYAAIDSTMPAPGLFLSSEGQDPNLITPASFQAAGVLAWAPDQSRIALIGRETSGALDALWTVRPDGTLLTQVSLPGMELFDPLDPEEPKWSPDSQSIAFRASSKPSEPRRLFVVSADGSEAIEVSDGIVPGNSVNADYAWSADGSLLAFTTTNLFLFTVQPNGDGLSIQLDEVLPSTPAQANIQWQPGGTALACLLIDPTDLRDRLVVLPVPGGPSIFATTNSGDVLSNWSWSPDGSRLAYLAEIGTFGPNRLFTIASDGSGQTQASGDHDVTSMRWSPSSEYVAYTALDSGRFSLFSADADGSARRVLSATVTAQHSVSSQADYDWMLDSTRVGYRASSLGAQGVPFEAVVASNAATGGDLVLLGEPYQLPDQSPSLPRWTLDGQSLVYLVTSGVGNSIQAAPADASGPAVDLTSDLNGGAVFISGFQLR